MSTKFDKFEIWGQARLIPVDLLIEPEWNANEMEDGKFAELCYEMKVGGNDEPCQIVGIPKGEHKGKFLVIGGSHRRKAAIANGQDFVPCVVKDHLDSNDEALLKEWTVKRNHLRGRLNEQKYYKLEKDVINRHKGDAAKARRSMLVGNIAEKLEKAASKTASSSATNGDTDGERDRTKSVADRQKLLSNLRTIEQDVLLESGDTIEHDYLFFGQSGRKHLVIQESKQLAALVSKMVEVCKNESANINDFLCSAIRNELSNWQ